MRSVNFSSYMNLNKHVFIRFDSYDLTAPMCDRDSRLCVCKMSAPTVSTPSLQFSCCGRLVAVHSRKWYNDEIETRKYPALHFHPLSWHWAVSAHVRNICVYPKCTDSSFTFVTYGFTWQGKNSHSFGIKFPFNFFHIQFQHTHTIFWITTKHNL